MPTKREEITKIVNKLVNYGKEQNFPYFSDSVKIAKFRRDYTPDHIAGLTMKYLVPAHEQGIETLKGYLKVEAERLRMLGALSGVDEDVMKFQLSENQEDYVILRIIQIIDVITS